jgi:hypothetical protein
MRRPLLILLLALIALAAGRTLYFWNRPVAESADPWRAVPRQAAVVLQLPDAWGTWDRFTHTSLLWGAFEGVPAAAGAGRLLTATATRMEADAALRDALHGTSALVVLLREGGEDIGCLFIGTFTPGVEAPLATLSSLLGADAAAAQALAQGGTISVRPDTALPALSFAVQQGLWILAGSANVMEESLLQLSNGEPLTSDPLFAQAMATLGAGSDGHLLAHTVRAQRLLHKWWRPNALEHLDLPAGWAALDLRSRPDALLMSGLLVAEEEHPLLAAVQHQGTGQHGLARLLPATVTQLDVQHISDPVRWLADRRGIASGTQDEEAATLFHWVEGDMGLAIAPGGPLGPAQRWALFTSNDPDRTQDALEALCPADSPCDTLAHRGVRLTRLPMAGAHERLLGPAYAHFERPWWMLMGDVLVLSDDPAALRASIDVWNDGNSLAEEPRHTAWSERIGRDAGRMLWIDLGRSRNLLAAGMKAAHEQALATADRPWQQLGGLSLQLSPGQRGFHHLVIGLQHAVLEERSTDVLWSTALGAPASRRPDIVRNHTNNTREVLVQDERHRLHLLGSTGKVLWSRQLEGPIMGGVSQVDRFRNGKLQLVFNTAERLYLMDRNGKDVGGFPVDLKAGATAPVAVFDYDQERDYRLVVPTADGRLLNFGGDGLPVKGWEAARLASAATNEVRFIRIRNKDYLVVADGSGQVSLLDRRGQPRERCDLVLGEGALVQQVLPGTSLEATQIIWSMPDGRLLQATLHGSPELLAPEGGGRAWWADLDGDGQAEVVRMHGDSLQVWRDGRPVLERSFGGPVQTAFHPYQFGKGRWAIAVVRSDAGQIGLVNEMGQYLDGLPLPGSVAPVVADLNLDGRFELVTITADGTVVAYSVPSVAGASP